MKQPGVMMMVLAAAIVTGPLPAQEQPLPVDEEAIVREMQELVDRTGDFPEADRGRLEKLFQKGIRLHDAHKYAEAVETYKQALEIYPLLDSVYYEIAFTYSHQGNQVEALDAVTRALALNPKVETYYVVKGSILDDLGLSEAALRTYRELLEVQPESYLGHLNLGITLERAGRYEESEQAYLQAMAVQPEHPSAYFHIARLCGTRGFDYDERDYLEKFVELSEEGPRKEQVQKRLEEMNETEIQIDTDHPHAEVEMARLLGRAVWRSERHRENFPEARGYEPTFEEERDVITLILEVWRAKKEQDPSVEEGYYDLLLGIDDAGFIEEYIWYHNQKVFGERAEEWIASHEDRMSAFLSWARAEGLLADDTTGGGEPDPEAATPFAYRHLPGELMKLVVDSPVAYNLHAGDEEEGGGRSPDALLEAERRRFGKRLNLRGEDRLACGRVLAEAQELQSAVGSEAYVPVMRCSRPGEDEHSTAVKQISRFGLRASEIDFRPVGGLQVTDEGVDLWAGSAWMFYVMAKAAWRNEPDLRREQSGPENGERPSIEEELYALAVLSGAYVNSFDRDKGSTAEDEGAEADPPQRVEALDRLVDAVRAGQLRGYALYEVIHKAYGLPLDALGEADAAAVGAYVQAQVFVRIVPSE